MQGITSTLWKTTQDSTTSFPGQPLQAEGVCARLLRMKGKGKGGQGWKMGGEWSVCTDDRDTRVRRRGVHLADRRVPGKATWAPGGRGWQIHKGGLQERNAPKQPSGCFALNGRQDNRSIRSIAFVRSRKRNNNKNNNKGERAVLGIKGRQQKGANTGVR